MASNESVIVLGLALVAVLGVALLVSSPVVESCVIRDSHGSTILLYVADGEVWQVLQTMKQQHLHKWVGGKLLRDTQSVLGFKFDSQNLIVADFTIETYQTWLLDISDRLEYWLSVGSAVVWAEVVDQPDGYQPA